MAKLTKPKILEPKPINNYGMPGNTKLNFPEGLPQVTYDEWAFNLNWPIEKGGLGRLRHFKNICRVRFPWIEWNPWLERQIEALCNNNWVSFMGCAASGKTTASALFAVVYWLCDPEHTAVILTSTEKQTLRKRVWPWIQRLYSDCQQTNGTRWKYGIFADSKTLWRNNRNDERCSISGVAVKQGGPQKAVDFIKGIHAKRMFIVVDEATSCPEVVFDAAANLYAGSSEFKFLAIGNPKSRLDMLGKFSEPADGWLSVSAKDMEWETKKQLNGRQGVCLRFDAEESPNITCGEVKWPYLVTATHLANAKKRYGEGHPIFWSEYRGFLPPEGIVKTVFSESMLDVHDARGKFKWMYPPVMGCACDPAFGGGDRPIIRFFQMGKADNGKICIQLEEPQTLRFNVFSTNPVHYQLRDQIVEMCEARNVQPRMFGLDASGEGGGLADLLSRSWGMQIVRVEFGGKASSMTVSSEDVRLCCDVYDRRATELWFSAKETLQAEQIKGIDIETSIELCTRLYEDEKRIKLEPKPEYRQRIGRSPDLADTVVIAVEIARQRGMIITPTYSAGREAVGWDSLADKAQREWENDTTPEVNQPAYFS